MKMPFGKYRGEDLEDIASVDPGYLRWALANVEFRSPALKRAIREALVNEDDDEGDGEFEAEEWKRRWAELETRYASLSDDLRDLERKAITPERLTSVYRKMAMRYHPDRGGSNEHMKVLNEVIEELRRGTP
jgi:hypothetical protein